MKKFKIEDFDTIMAKTFLGAIALFCVAAVLVLIYFLIVKVNWWLLVIMPALFVCYLIGVRMLDGKEGLDKLIESMRGKVDRLP